MKYFVYDSAGNELSSYDTRTGQPVDDAHTTPSTGVQSSTSGGTAVSYTDVGILSLQMNMPQGNIYDFRVPGDPNNNTFQFRFPRAGYVLGVTMTGTFDRDSDIGIYVTRYNANKATQDDVLTPAQTQQHLTRAKMAANGYRYTVSSPIPYQQDDTVQMKVISPNNPLNVDLAAFVSIQY